MSSEFTRPVALLILDGWGIAPAGPGNAVDLADTPTFDAIWKRDPHTQLVASGEDVGLPAGQIGNSEVGHLNLGAGRVVFQDLARINHEVAHDQLGSESVLVAAFERARSREATLHVVALCSFGGVHSQLRHVEAIVQAAAKAGTERVLVHAITDGRDVSPTASLDDFPGFERTLAKISNKYGVDARVASVIGRYWAMDRDKRWPRTERMYELLTRRVGTTVDSAVAAVRASHDAGTTDEFVEPFVIEPAGVVADADRLIAGDVVLCANFRPDRMRQLVHALVDDEDEWPADAFDRGHVPDVDVVTLTEYESSLPVDVVLAPRVQPNTLADVLEDAGVGQLHVAETEKYAHVTYFFNGGLERVHDGEDRELAPSPRDVATYDLKPEMSAAKVADLFLEGWNDPNVAFAVLNFANPDMVGHTGSIPAAIAACETADTQLARVLEAVESRGGVALVTADHGNAEQMLTEDGKPHTAHTTNPVPLVLVGDVGDVKALRDGGRLGDVAPTILDLLGLPQPDEMTCVSLLQGAHLPA